jgi:ribosomal-protein-alanine N-acetyltransferase
MNALLQLNWVRRSMTVGDLDAIMAVEVLAYSHPWTRGNFIDSLAAGYLAEVLEAREAGLVGYFVAMPGVDELHLLNITIAPAWQNHGLGGALLDTVQDHGRVRGDEKLWLEVRQSNHRARALYRRRGFAEMGLRRGYYPASAREREDAVVMSLSLNGGGANGVE